MARAVLAQTLVVAIVATLLTCVTAHADTPTWSAPFELGAAPASPTGGVAGALEDDGSAHAAWLNGSGSVQQLWLSDRIQDTTWNAPVALTPASPSNAAVRSFAFAGNGDGALAAIWVDDGGTRVQLRWRDPNAAWSAPQVLQSATTAGALDYQPAVTVDETGRTTVAWFENAGCDDPSPGYCYSKLHAAVRDVGDLAAVPAPAATGAQVTPAQPGLVAWLSGPTGYGSPGYLAIASNARGDALVSYTYFAASGKTSAGAALSKQHGTFDDGVDVGYKVTGSPGPVMPLLDGDGNATAAWSQSVSGGSNAVFASDRAVSDTTWSGTPSSPGLLSTSGVSAYTPVAAVGTGGQSLIVWTQLDPSTRYVFGVQRSAFGNGWSTPAKLSGTWSSSNVSLWGAHVTADGSATVLLTTPGVATSGYVWSQTRDDQGAWSEPAQISAGSNAGAASPSWFASLSANADDDLLAVWRWWPSTTGNRVAAAATVDGPPAPTGGGGGIGGGGNPGGGNPGGGNGDDPGGGAPASQDSTRPLVSAADPLDDDPGDDDPGDDGDAPVRLTLTIPSSQPKTTLKTALRSGVATTLSCSRACSVSGRLTTTASVARRLGLIAKTSRSAKPVAIGYGSMRISRAGGRARLVVKLSAKAVRALRRARSASLTLTLTATAGSTKTTRTRPVALR